MADTTEQAPKDLIGFLDFYFVKKAPFQIPDNGKEIIVKIAPWIMLVLLIFAIPAMLFLLGIGAAVLPVAVATGGVMFYPSMILSCVALVMRAIALPGLFKRSKSGWTMAFYASLVSCVASLIGLNLISAIIGGLISFYLLFQVREKYN